MSWVKYDKENRSVFLPKLLLAVRLPLIPITYIVNSIEAEPLISENSKCK